MDIGPGTYELGGSPGPTACLKNFRLCLGSKHYLSVLQIVARSVYRLSYHYYYCYYYESRIGKEMGGKAIRGYFMYKTIWGI
jgi:hypothetical protein